jgi:hypothetical protein
MHTIPTVERPAPALVSHRATRLSLLQHRTVLMPLALRTGILVFVAALAGQAAMRGRANMAVGMPVLLAILAVVVTLGF